MPDSSPEIVPFFFCLPRASLPPEEKKKFFFHFWNYVIHTGAAVYLQTVFGLGVDTGHRFLGMLFIFIT